MGCFILGKNIPRREKKPAIVKSQMEAQRPTSSKLDQSKTSSNEAVMNAPTSEEILCLN